MRYLALDWGSVRIGAAISDPEGKIAFPMQNFIHARSAFAEIKKIVSELEVDRLLVGQPRAMSGGETDSTKQAIEFVQHLKEQTSLPVELFDERLSSVAARRVLAEQGVSEKKQRLLADNLAAQTMLQRHLDIMNQN